MVEQIKKAVEDADLVLVGIGEDFGISEKQIMNERPEVFADETLGERLEKLGVVVRSCGNYPGLDDSWYRTAVRTRRENDALLAALREAMA